MAVKLTTLGSDVRDLEFREGVRASEYLAEADIELGRHMTLSINGEPASPDDTVEDDSVVVVAPKIKNGI